LSSVRRRRRRRRRPSSRPAVRPSSSAVVVRPSVLRRESSFSPSSSVRRCRPFVAHRRIKILIISKWSNVMSWLIYSSSAQLLSKC
jgi:hypothetical protein